MHLLPNMNEPLQITFRGMDSSPALETLIRERAERLARLAPSLQRCHVVVEQPHRHQQSARRFSVRLEISTPLGEIVVTRAPEGAGRFPAPQPLIREAFDAATRQLEERAERRRAG